MRFDFAIGFIFLTGVALATPVGELFQVNREAILSKVTTIIDKTVFSVGRAKSSSKAGDNVGFSKAALFAYDNLVRLNFEQAEWPDGVGEEERRAVWKAYRASRPFALTVENGQRIYQEKFQDGRFLLVMAFPRDHVILPRVTKSELLPYVNAYRQAQKMVENELLQEKGGETVRDERPLGREMKNVEMESLDPIRGAQITPAASPSAIKKTENFDADLML